MATMPHRDRPLKSSLKSSSSSSSSTTSHYSPSLISLVLSSLLPPSSLTTSSMALEPEPPINPHVDLVISFRAQPASATSTKPASKAETRKALEKATYQYAKLMNTLNTSTGGALKAVGRRGEALGHILVFVTAGEPLIEALVRRERERDWVSGVGALGSSALLGGAAVSPPNTSQGGGHPLTPSDRIRLVHAYIASAPAEGGLGVCPDNRDEWDLVEFITPLHDREFAEMWVRGWTVRRVLGAGVQIGRIREEFGDSIALYFSFLSSYTRLLLPPAMLGLIAHYLLPPYSPIYSILLTLYSIAFVEYWRVRERILSLRWGSRGSIRAEHRRAAYIDEGSSNWWKRDIRVLASIPIICIFALALSLLLTLIFILEAFLTHLIIIPASLSLLRPLIPLLPTLLFVLLVPRFMALYTALARRLTEWENHKHQSTYERSLTLKIFALSGLVAYLGLGLSAFVYVPFGEGVMRVVQRFVAGLHVHHVGGEGWVEKIVHGFVGYNLIKNFTSSSSTNSTTSSTSSSAPPKPSPLFDTSPTSIRSKLNPKRLHDQMFAFTVTNQVVNTFMEVGLPFVLRWVGKWRAGRNANAKDGNGNGKVHSPTGWKDAKPPGSALKSSTFPPISSIPSNSNSNTLEPPPPSSNASSNSNGPSSPSPSTHFKRVLFIDDLPPLGSHPAERAYLDAVRAEMALPAYDVFTDYSEMVVQFGYVVVWSAIWPLAAVMALLNNILELRSDAFKMTVHQRRPIPTRTDTIGPWLDALSFLTWLGALINAALVFLFSPQISAAAASPFYASTAPHPVEKTIEEHLHSASSGDSSSAWGVDGTTSPSTFNATYTLLLRAALVALIASHVYWVIRKVVRHVVERVFWTGSREVEEREREEREVRARVVGGGVGLGLNIVERDVVVVEKIDEMSDEKKREDEFWAHDEGLEEIQRISKEQ